MVSFSFLIAPWRVAHSECAKFSIFGNSVAFFQRAKNNVNVVKKCFVQFFKMDYRLIFLAIFSLSKFF